MTFNWVGLAAVVIFYVLILLVGIWAARKGQKTDAQMAASDMNESGDLMLAGRDIGIVVGVFTMTATWVGGGYINGTAEMVYRTGLVWCQAPIGYCLSLILGGLLFAEKMRSKGYVTMLDPFQIRYGERIGGLLFLPALLGEIFWSAAILSALGATLAVILDIDQKISIIASACIAVFYTFFGGLYSVAYTDVVQLGCIFVGLWVCVPTSMLNPNVPDIAGTFELWKGEMGEFKHFLNWMDTGFLLIFGGIPWQVYFQRVLSSKSARKAQLLSYVAAFGCLVMAIPPILIGAVAKSTNWTQTDWIPPEGYNITADLHPDFMNLVLPLVLQYLTPPWVAFIGLGAISAAVMSSADSSILSAAAMFARNVWKLSVRPRASEVEIIRVMRVAVVIVGVLATIMALVIRSIYELWFLCADLVYVILFPQLLCVVYLPAANTYGCLVGYAVGLFFRLTGGEPAFGIPALIQWKYYDESTGIQYFPFRTVAMLLSLLSIFLVSTITQSLFVRGTIPAKFDIGRCNVEGLRGNGSSAAMTYLCGGDSKIIGDKSRLELYPTLETQFSNDTTTTPSTPGITIMSTTELFGKQEDEHKFLPSVNKLLEPNRTLKTTQNSDSAHLQPPPLGCSFMTSNDSTELHHSNTFSSLAPLVDEENRSPRINF